MKTVCRKENVRNVKESVFKALTEENHVFEIFLIVMFLSVLVL